MLNDNKHLYRWEWRRAKKDIVQKEKQWRKEWKEWKDWKKEKGKKEREKKELFVVLYVVDLVVVRLRKRQCLHDSGSQIQNLKMNH